MLAKSNSRIVSILNRIIELVAYHERLRVSNLLNEVYACVEFYSNIIWCGVMFLSYIMLSLLVTCLFVLWIYVRYVL